MLKDTTVGISEEGNDNDEMNDGEFLQKFSAGLDDSTSAQRVVTYPLIHTIIDTLSRTPSHTHPL